MRCDCIWGMDVWYMRYNVRYDIVYMKCDGKKLEMKDSKLELVIFGTKILCEIWYEI